MDADEMIAQLVRAALRANQLQSLLEEMMKRLQSQKMSLLELVQSTKESPLATAALCYVSLIDVMHHDVVKHLASLNETLPPYCFEASSVTQTDEKIEVH